MEEEEEKENKKIQITVNKWQQTFHIYLAQIYYILWRISMSETVVRVLSIVCLCSMFALFLIQMHLLYSQRQFNAVTRIITIDDLRSYYYPEFYNLPHNEENWCWDPHTLLLRVNTTYYVH